MTDNEEEIEDEEVIEKKQGLSSFWHAFINLWKGTIVLGILALSYDYKECGDLGGFTSIIFVSLINLYSVFLYLKVLD